MATAVVASGLTVIAIRQPGVPLVEVRLRIPFAGTGASFPARTSLLADAMLAGTADRNQVQIAEELQGIGADLGVGGDADRLSVGGVVLRSGLHRLLELLAEVLTGAAYPAREVAAERDRLIERVGIARSQPAVIAGEALALRMYGEHPYARELPQVDAVARVTPAALRSLHGSRVVPTGATLVLVGDLSPGSAIDAVETALAGWTGQAGPAAVPSLPEQPDVPPLFLDRAGSVQSSIRLGGPALPRHDPGYAALQLANLIFGGAFSSRLVENIREDKGYTYTPNSRIEHAVAGSSLVVQADVASEVTAPTLVEIGYELGKMATLPVTEAELESARQYAVGTLALSIASQAGLAGTVAGLSAVGLGMEWLREHPARLARVTVEEVAEQAQRFLAPGGLVGVVLGDAAIAVPGMRALGPLELRSAAGDAA